MSKSDPAAAKKERNRMIRWVVTIFLVTIVISGTISYVSGEIMEIIPETKIVTKKIVITQRIVLLRSFFCALGSAFDTTLVPFMTDNNGSRQDKSYGLGRVVFHRTEPAVAAQAVSI